ncbi:error-prone DNA polymerase [Burkholderiaceae bacterium DAT-1]|nr:error-prone DNA polymerase [Burkholderiaceae bacterium DAT-1]
MYAELHCLSNFSFQRGASHAFELVARAAALGYHAIAITDECSLAGIVRAHVAAKEHGIKLIIGSEMTLADGLRLVLLAPDREAYGDLSDIISCGRRHAEKGEYRLDREMLAPLSQRLLCLWPAKPDCKESDIEWLQTHFANRLWLSVTLCHTPEDAQHTEFVQMLAEQTRLPICASGDVHMHDPRRRALQDVLTAIRIGKPLTQCGQALFPNGERHLRDLSTLSALYSPEWLAATIDIADRCTFNLDTLRYEYPGEVIPPGMRAIDHLRQLGHAGLTRRYPAGVPELVREQVEKELVLIEQLQFEHYFLTVEDIVSYARSQGILCQGRGSAANSALCYALGITEVDPARSNVLFERFISKARHEPPDIDVDFESQRREEVMQYLYSKYGRDRAALTATVITYRRKSAIRDVGRALGLEEALLDRIIERLGGGDPLANLPLRMQEAGLDTDAPICRMLLALVKALLGFPRHLSQHVGGFVLSRGPLTRLVPVENAAMPDRTVIQWDKDDLDAMQLLKVDILSLGMLSAIRESLAHIARFRDRPGFALQDIPPECPMVYDMLCKGDSIGVFQVESRAQISMLPRLQPRCFYDLVVEVAIVRPGPIQGGMVHPYLDRREMQRQGLPLPPPESKEVAAVLSRTLGIPIFQEQVMQLSMVAAGFSPERADQLRRSMAAWRRTGKLDGFRPELIDGMLARGYQQDFAERLFEQIKGFSEYGFPESHAASFALLVYASAWLKCHEPAIFLCALINAQPMGFYSPSQLVQDARRHGVAVREVDVQSSHWDCTLEPLAGAQPAVRLGLRLVDGFSKEDSARLVSHRPPKGYRTINELARLSGLTRRALGALANADALRSLSGNRRQAWWDVSGLEQGQDHIARAIPYDVAPILPVAGTGEEVRADYQSTGLSLRAHPLELLRSRLDAERLLSARTLLSLSDKCLARACGIVTGRQRPGTANGVVFVTLEDETGNANIIVWPDLAEKQRAILLGARMMAVFGIIQRKGDVVHLLAKMLVDKSDWLGELDISSRDFH